MEIIRSFGEMKPLTIEQLKSLEVGDWVWIDYILGGSKFYTRKYAKSDDVFDITEIPCELPYFDYNKTWLAYKNKEQAECVGEIVELPVLIDHCVPTDIEGSFIYIKELVYKSSSGYIETRLYYEDEFEEAERRLAELKGEGNDKRRV